MVLGRGGACGGGRLGSRPRRQRPAQLVALERLGAGGAAGVFGFLRQAHVSHARVKLADDAPARRMDNFRFVRRAQRSARQRLFRRVVVGGDRRHHRFRRAGLGNHARDFRAQRRMGSPAARAHKRTSRRRRRQSRKGLSRHYGTQPELSAAAVLRRKINAVFFPKRAE